MGLPIVLQPILKQYVKRLLAKLEIEDAGPKMRFYSFTLPDITSREIEVIMKKLKSNKFLELDQVASYMVKGCGEIIKILYFFICNF